MYQQPHEQEMMDGEGPGFQQQEPQYEQDNIIQDYGSIIKDLTDTDKMLTAFEMRLLGLGYDPEDKNKIIKFREPLMEAELVRDFLDQIRSIVNQNTHFTYYDKTNVENILFIAGYQLPRWLMMQGNGIARKHRGTINFMAMNLIMESLHKANDGKILKWTKGSFREGSNRNDDFGKKGMMDKFMFWKRKN